MESKVIELIESVLSDEEQQLLKDTIRYGSWGDGQYDFKVDGEIRTEWMMGYCVNDAKDGGHFEGKKLGPMFRSIYKKLGLEKGAGEYISHASDWWGDGSGDMLFVRDDVYQEIKEWAKE